MYRFLFALLSAFVFALSSLAQTPIIHPLEEPVLTLDYPHTLISDELNLIFHSDGWNIKVWDFESKSDVYSMTSDVPVREMALSSDGNLLATINFDQDRETKTHTWEIRIWDFVNEQLVDEKTVLIEDYVIFNGVSILIKVLSFSDSNDVLWFVNAEGALLTWNRNTDEVELKNTAPHLTNVRSPFWLSNTHFAYEYHDQDDNDIIEVYSVVEDKVVFQTIYEQISNFILLNYIDYSNIENTFYVTQQIRPNRDSEVVFWTTDQWNYKTGEKNILLEDYESPPMNQGLVSPDGSFISLNGTSKISPYILDFETKNKVAIFNFPGTFIDFLQISPSGLMKLVSHGIGLNQYKLFNTKPFQTAIGDFWMY